MTEHKITDNLSTLFNESGAWHCPLISFRARQAHETKLEIAIHTIVVDPLPGGVDEIYYKRCYTEDEDQHHLKHEKEIIVKK